MICRQCQRRVPGLASRLRVLRAFSTAQTHRNAAAAAAVATSSEASEAATPSRISGSAANPAASARSKAPTSSCPEGTVLTGLNYFKGKTDPVALPDEEYPDWLWRCLEVLKKDQNPAASEDAGDEFSKSKKQRRLAAKRQRQLEAKMLAGGNLEELIPPVPLQHQSINLPGQEGQGLEEAVLAAQKRDELRRAMRKERRAKIKESNYLKSM